LNERHIRYELLLQPAVVALVLGPCEPGSYLMSCYFAAQFSVISYCRQDKWSGSDTPSSTAKAKLLVRETPGTFRNDVQTIPMRLSVFLKPDVAVERVAFMLYTGKSRVQSLAQRRLLSLIFSWFSSDSRDKLYGSIRTFSTCSEALVVVVTY
jgi:hypothetical protein